MRFTRRGGLTMRLDDGEAPLLTSLLDELVGVLTDHDPDDPVHQRLYPAAYDGAEEAAEYRSFTEAPLRDERVQRVKECTAQLGEQAPSLSLAGDAADRWLRVLNDLRLSLGTRIGITEDFHQDIDPTDPAQLPQAAYLWLTAVQDMLVRAAYR